MTSALLPAVRGLRGSAPAAGGGPVAVKVPLRVSPQFQRPQSVTDLTPRQPQTSDGQCFASRKSDRALCSSLGSIASRSVLFGFGEGVAVPW